VKESKPPQAVVCDLGGVVINIEPEAIPRNLAAAVGLPVERVAAVVQDEQLVADHDSGRLTFDQFRREVERRLGREIPPEVFDASWNSLFRGVTAGMERLLPQLRKCARVVALSNTSARHDQVFSRLYRDVLGNFERIFKSHKMGLLKPQGEIYKAVLEYLNLPAELIVHIDDRQVHVDGAAAVGMRAFVATSTDQVADQLRQMGLPLG